MTKVLFIFLTLLPFSGFAATEAPKAPGAGTPQAPGSQAAAEPSDTALSREKSEPRSPVVFTLDELMKLRDPFSRPDVKEGQVIKLSELLTISVEDLKVVGILRGLGAPRAMLAAPSGKTYFVREGQKIGKKGGSVYRISYETVVVREKLTNILGREENLDSELALAPEFAKEVTSNRNQGW